MIVTYNGIVAKAETPADVERIATICGLLDDFHKTVFDSQQPPATTNDDRPSTAKGDADDNAR